MKKTLLFIFLCTSVVIAKAQTKAVTETGDEIIIYDDGTWTYVDESIIDEDKEIPLNAHPFTKPDNASFLLKSKKINVGIWLDPKKWSFNKAIDNPDGEYEVELKGGDLYGILITEEIEIPIETLKSIAIENAQVFSTDLKIVEEEYRYVNGIKVLFMQMDGVMQGIKFSYYSYYYSNENGTLQFVMYTAQNLLKKYKNDCKELLNGLVKLEEEED